MSLISCPECKHQVSDKAHSCPNCGYPILSTEQAENGLNKSYCLLFKRLGAANKIEVIKEVRRLLSIDLYDAKKIVDNAPSVLIQNVSLRTAENIQQKLELLNAVTVIEECNSKLDETTLQKETEIKQILDKHKDDTVRCPRCGSSAITTGQRGFSLFTGFLGSNKTVNRCGKCGWTWQPK